MIQTRNIASQNFATNMSDGSDLPRSNSALDYFAQNLGDLFAPAFLQKLSQLQPTTNSANQKVLFAHKLDQLRELYEDRMSAHGQKEALTTTASILQPIIASLEAVTGLKILAFAGGSDDDDIGAIKISSQFDGAQDQPIVLSKSLVGIFPQTAQFWINDLGTKIIEEWVATAHPPKEAEGLLVKRKQYVETYQHVNAKRPKTSTTTNRNLPSRIGSLSSTQRPDGFSTTSNSLAPLGKQVGSSSQRTISKSKRSSRLSTRNDFGARMDESARTVDMAFPGPSMIRTMSHGRGRQNEEPDPQYMILPVSPSTSKSGSAGMGNPNGGFYYPFPMPAIVHASSNPKLLHNPHAATSSTSKKSTEVQVRDSDKGRVERGPQASGVKKSSGTLSSDLVEKFIESLSKTEEYQKYYSHLMQKIPLSAHCLRNSLAPMFKNNLGAPFRKLLSKLVTREVLCEFSTEFHTRTVFVYNRPKEISTWLQNGRGRWGKEVIVVDIVDFAQRWWVWWREIQPKWNWRLQDTNIVGGHGTADSTQIDDIQRWEDLCHSSGNVLNNLVASLHGWGTALLKVQETMSDERKEIEDQSWIWAVEECSMLMDRIIKSMEEDPSLESGT